MNIPGTKPVQEKPAKILIVDDERANINILNEILGDTYELMVARSGEQALRIALSGAPDLILLDIMMPGMNGHEVCRRLKARSETASIPIIFITAKGDAEDETLGLEMGAVDYISKPFHNSVVKARVQSQIAIGARILALLKRQNPIAASIDAGLTKGLTERQKEILKWVKAGKTNVEIAIILGCSQDNVKYHLKKIFSLFEMNNRTHLVTKLGTDTTEPDG